MSQTNASPEKIDYTVQVHFLSDWHVGSGLERPGSVDRLVQRDADGFPFVPAKTLTGMFRDAAEEVAIRLDNGEVGGPWYRWVLWLFGDQPTRSGQNEQPETLGWRQLHDAQVSLRPGQLPRLLREAIGGGDRNCRDLREALFVEKAGVKIGRHGQAENKHLRLDEMVRGGITLTAPLSLTFEGLDEAQQETAKVMLLLAAQFVERLGGKRRRGAGRVNVHVVGDGLPSREETAEYLANYLSNHPQPAPLPNEPGTAQSASLSSPATESDWWVMPFRLVLRTPLLVPERTIGNVVKSLDFVPGTYLLPILTRAFRASLPGIRQWIMAGDIRISPATLEIDGKRGLPVPAALFHPKGNDPWFELPGQVTNRFCDDENEDHVKDFRAGYIVPDPSADKLPKYKRPHKVVRPHNTVEEQSQRPTTEVGGVFSYEVIAAGTVLIGQVRIRGNVKQQLDRSRWSDIRQRLNGEHGIGRSKKDDYGQVELEVVQDEWTPLETTKIEQPLDELTVWLVSDTILTDDRLATATTAEQLSVEIAKALDLTPDELNGEPTSFLRHRRIESWHVGWGLPRESLVTIAAGSCIRLKFKSPLSIAAIHALQSTGIGRRRAEGYGMLQVQSRLLTNPIEKWATAQSDQQPASRSPTLIPRTADVDEVRTLARLLETECWRRRIRKEVLEQTAADHGRLLKFGGDKPNAAQAALLRNLLRMELSDSDMVARLERLEQMRGTSWPDGCLENIRSLFSNAEAIWKKLGASTWPVLTVGGREELTNNHRRYAITALIDAAVRAHQRDRERRRELASAETADT